LQKIDRYSFQFIFQKNQKKQINRMKWYERAIIN